jgi:hypothetical protein
MAGPTERRPAMCYELEQYWVQRAEEARRDAQRREEEQRAREKAEKPAAPDGVKDPEPVPV